MPEADLFMQQEDEVRRRREDAQRTFPTLPTRVEIPLPTAGLTREQARTQGNSLFQGITGKDLDPTSGVWNDLDSIFAQSKEGGQYQGEGYNRPFADMLTDYGGTLRQRFPGPPAAPSAPTQPGMQQAITQAQAGTPSTQPGVSMLGAQFDDPYTKLFEDTAKQYLGRLTGQNAELDRLMKFIGDQFGELSTSQGYSPEEQAILRTQALEPIERDRQALNQRVLERTAARGILPSSGLHELDLRGVDRDAETRRTVAQRDLAINAINKRTQDRGTALSLARLGLDVPNQQGQQALGVANQLYQLPRTALLDSLQVLNASSPQSAISPLLQQQQQAQQQAQFDQQRTAQLWAQIGQLLAGLNL